jgi:hypothetical protein
MLLVQSLLLAYEPVYLQCGLEVLRRPQNYGEEDEAVFLQHAGGAEEGGFVRCFRRSQDVCVELGVEEGERVELREKLVWKHGRYDIESRSRGLFIRDLDDSSARSA